MNRLVAIGGIAFVVLMMFIFVSGFVFNPVETKRSNLEERLRAVAVAEDTYEGGASVAYGELERAILDKPSLWEPLIRKPEQPAPPPNLEEMLSNVVLTRLRMGTGDDVRVKILVTGEDGEKPYWIRKGDIVNGLTVKEITREYVIFSMIHAGKEQTAKLIP